MFAGLGTGAGTMNGNGVTNETATSTSPTTQMMGTASASASTNVYQSLSTQFRQVLEEGRVKRLWGPVPCGVGGGGGGRFGGRGDRGSGGAVEETSLRWDTEWARSVGLESDIESGTFGLGSAFGPGPCRVYIPGSLEGVWEGLFTVSILPFFTTRKLFFLSKKPPSLTRLLLICV